MPLTGRVISTTDPEEIVEALRNVIDAKPIGPVSMCVQGNNIVLMFDSSVGSQLTTGTNAAVGTTPVQLTQTPTKGREIIVQAAPTNTANVYIGGSSAQNLVLVAGAALSLDWTDVADIWVYSALGVQVVNWIVRG